MQITKIFQIQTKFHLYDILDKNPNLVDKNSNFLPFFDSMFAYYNGCKCLEESYLENSDIEYEQLSNSNDIKETLKEYFSCDDILFK